MALKAAFQFSLYDTELSEVHPADYDLPLIVQGDDCRRVANPVSSHQCWSLVGLAVDTFYLIISGVLVKFLRLPATLLAGLHIEVK